MNAANEQVTHLLGSLRSGDRSALDRILPLVYDELRGVARAQLLRHHDPPTIQATSLVHDVYLKLAGSGAGLDVQSRAHFLSVAARAMRQVLVDQARKRKAAKRGGGLAHATLGSGGHAMEVREDGLLAIDEAMQGLEARQREIAEYRLFAGMNEEEIALVLGISTRTVRRDWVKARAWLVRAVLGEQAAGEDAG